MDNIVSALTARTQFGQILRRASQKDERFFVERRGEPSVIIMSLKDYVDNVAPAPQWLRDVQAASKRRGTDKFSMRQINRIIAEDSARPKRKTQRLSR